MTTAATTLLPRTANAPGQLLWGEEPRRQPIAPLVLMAALLLLVATPTALAGSGGSSNPMVLLRSIADTTYELTGLIQQSNETLTNIDNNSKQMLKVQANLGGIAESSAGMAAKTTKLNETLGTVGETAKNQRALLESVDGKLTSTSKSMGRISTDIDGSLKATNAVVGEFTKIDTAIGAMDTNLKGAIGEMGRSGPLTKAFATNTTRVAITGGNSKKFGVPNFAPDNRVMSIVLPMIKSMQDGGALPARKDSHTATNPVIGTALKFAVPDGTNVVAKVRPYDGLYGLPPSNFFVEHRIHGF